MSAPERRVSRAPSGPEAPPAPPTLAVRLLERLLPANDRDAFLGDLEESFRSLLNHGLDARRARRWYWNETVRAPLTLARRARPDHVTAATRGDGFMSTLITDIRYALRLLAHRPGFTALAAFTLALGIGATTAIFSVVNPILFESLPYPQSSRIHMVWERTKAGTKDNIGYATYQDVRTTSTSFEASAAVGGWQPTMTGRAEPQLLSGQRVTPEFFRVLGVPPAIGRDFREEENMRGTPRVAILSQSLWRSQFGGDTALVGKLITLGGNPYTVIGVMPATFENVLDPTVQLWSLLRYDISLPQACRSCHHLRMIARLKAGVSAARVERELAGIGAGLLRDHPTDYETGGFLTPSLQEETTSGVKSALLAVLGAVVLVLLIACANVTNLLLARGAQRKAEFSVRAALGAGRARLVRQLLTESLALAVIGGALGVGVAVLGVKTLVALSPPGLPRVDAIGIDAGVLGFTLAVTTVVGLIFGLVPALHATGAGLHARIKESGRRVAGGSRVTRGSLVVSEVALALVLLVGSGLLLRSMERLFAVSPGFDATRLLTMQVQAGGGRLQNDTLIQEFFHEVQRTVTAVPGVDAAALTSQLPLSGDFDGYGMHSESHPRANPAEDPSAFRYGVSPGYFEAMHIPLVSGRFLGAEDRAGQRPVIVVNESFARRHWPAGDAVGQRYRVGDPANGPWREIVGVVGDVRQLSLSGDATDAVYAPESQWLFTDNAMTLVVRSRGDAAALAPAVRRAVWSVDRDQPIVRIATMERLVELTAAPRRFTLVLFEAFAAVALVLATAGIYGVLAGTVTERLREIGVRTALGATRRDILVLVLRQGLTLTAAGMGVGLLVALLGSQAISGMLYGVSRADPFTYGAMTLLLVAAAFVACWIPAWRATRVDPVETLRAD